MPYIQVPDSRSGDGFTWNWVDDGAPTPVAGGPVGMRSSNFSLGGVLGGIVGGIGGLVTGTGVITGAETGYHAGQTLFGGGGSSSPSLPALPGGSAGFNIPGVGTAGVIPFGFGNSGPPAPRPHGHMTKGTRKNPSHWSNRARPRMNPMNVRAARRAVSRIHAAEKLFRRVLSVSHPGKPHGHIAPKKRK